MSDWEQTRVPPKGPQTSKILLCGESPGQKETELLEPFVGAAGKILDDLLLESGIERSQCYLTNLVKYRPRGNDFSVFYDDKRQPKQILTDGITEVLDEIMLVRPNLVVLLGAEPLKAITGKVGITKWRGSILSATMPDGLQVKCLATFHPAAVLRNWEYRPVALFDMQRANEQSVYPEVNVKERVLVTNPTYNEVITELTRLKSSEYVSFDIETETNQITCVGFSDSASWAICVPFWYGASGSLWSRDQELEIWTLIKELLESPTVKKIAQNAQFDCTMLADLMDINTQGLWMDTMIAGHLCYPELPKGLDFLTSIYTDQPYYKDMIREGDMVRYWQYNCLDACCTYEVAHEVKKELKDLGMWEVYTDYVHKLIEPLMEISRRGVKIDLPLRKVAVKQYRNKILELQTELNTIVGHELNVNSPKQMQEWLYKDMGYKPKFKRRENNVVANTVTADEEAIREIARTNPRREFDIVLEIRGLKKVLSTYLEAKLDPDGRIRTTYLITGTETGRLSSRESVHGTGTNLQNVPKGIARRLFLPDGENIFVSGDLSQAEARVVAYLAGEDSLIRLFETGGDIHRRNAAAIFRVHESSVTDKQRQLAKRVVHASNYGMGPVTFAKQAGIPLYEARRLLNAYFATYPGIKLWQMQVVSKLNRSRQLSTPFGRKRLFMGTFNESLKKEAYAYVPQSTVSDMLNTGLLLLHSQLPIVPGAELMLQVHDSVVVQCPPMAMSVVCDMIKRSLEQPIQITGVDGVARTCKIPCDLQAGYDWDSLEKISSPFIVPERKEPCATQ